MENHIVLYFQKTFIDKIFNKDIGLHSDEDALGAFSSSDIYLGVIVVMEQQFIHT